MDPFEYDVSVRNRGFSLIAGVDEAGRGSLAGPVVAAAVILPSGLRIDGIRDSKKIPERERICLYDKIMLHASATGVGVVDAAEIDRINILQATRQAMHDAVNCLGMVPDLLLIDALTIPTLSLTQMPVIKGDAKSASIAAASIIAKVVRDRIMDDYHMLYSSYGFRQHKGYATKMHIAMIQQHGPCHIHRKSFRHVVSLMLPFDGLRSEPACYSGEQGRQVSDSLTTVRGHSE